MLSFTALSSSAISSIPSAFSAFGTIEAELVTGDNETLRIYAATKEFISRASDDPPNRPFLGTLEKPISFEHSIINAGGFGEISVGYGELELINAEGDYDRLIGLYGIDGQRVRLRVGMVQGGIVSAYSTFSLLADLTATGWIITEDRVTVSLRDNSHKLEVAAQPNSYGGAGDVDGSADLAGKRKPIVVGEVRNISPPLLIPADLVYQVHDGPVEAIDAVYDAAGALINYGDYPNAAALLAAALSSGFVTCLDEGLFKLGAAPSGKVTADVRGDNSDGYIETTADVVKFLILNACELSEDDFDLETFDLLNASQPASIGYYLGTDKNETVAETVGKLMAGISGWCGFDSIGRLQLRQVESPSPVVVQRYDEFDLVTLTRDRLPSAIDPIIQRARVSYNVNWTVQQGTELIGDVLESDPDLVSYLASPFRVASPSVDLAAAIVLNHPLAIDPDPVVAYFVEAADAQAAADVRMALYGVERSLYRFTTKEHLFAQDVGDTIYLSAPRIGLADGKYLLVVQVRDDLERDETEIVGFG